MKLRNELELFDGKNLEILDSILSRHPPTRSLINELVYLISERESKIQAGATWLLKRFAENGVRVNTEQRIAIFDSLPALTDWVAKLHICQMLQHIEIPQGSERNVVWFLERNLTGENKFLRAWTYNGFYELAKQHEGYYDYAMEQIDRGDSEQSAAVKARIRNIRKAMKKLY